MKNDKFRKLIKKHIDDIGIDNINKMFKKIDCGPTNEEFFGKETAEAIRRRVNESVEKRRNAKKKAKRIKKDD